MYKTYLRLAFFVLFFTAFEPVTAQETSHSQKNHNTESYEADGGRVNTPTEINEYIAHHLKDAHDFHLFSYTNNTGERKHVGFPLPVIVWTSEGLKVFSSAAFHHDDDGHHFVQQGGVTLTKLHSKIYEVEKGATSLTYDSEHHPTNATKLLDFSITKSLFGTIIVGLLILLLFSRLAKQYKNKNIPTGSGRFLEPLVIYVRDEIARPNIGEDKYRKYMPYLLTVFFFIWISNLLGLTPLGFNITGQIAVTVCLALFTFFIVQFSGNKEYWKHIFWMPDVPIFMKIALIPIEVLGIFTKPFSLLIRLFANITAGHVVVMGLIALMMTLKAQFGVVGSTGLSVFLTLFLSVIEILVAFLQAFIFTMLSSLFIGMAVVEHHHDHAHDAAHGHDDAHKEELRERFV